ncbi:hypothetical protein [Absidia glauca]|uniref:Uncharacterized protein n=1 Tax=Absidia glauca TaxID=4829 RepID=A0A168SCD6_ABSGL|nr:hypothetical protein [Absidia glauca]
MYTTKKSHINVWTNNDASFHTEKLELPPPPPVPPHHTPLPPKPSVAMSSSAINTTTLQSQPSPLMRCTSLPHTSSSSNLSTGISQRPVSWHPIPNRRTSRFYQEDPEINAKLDRIIQSDRLLAIRARLCAPIIE